MDWKYLSSVNLEDLAEDDKDNLYNTVSWYDFQNEQLSASKYRTVLKLCQDILKYKGEQVSWLLTHLLA